MARIKIIVLFAVFMPWCYATASGIAAADTVSPEYYAGEIDDSGWWKRFGDPMLDSLVSLVQERNYDLAIAAKRVAIARESVRSAMSGYYPQLGISAGWTRSRSSGAARGQDVPASVASYWNTGATMQWEVDVFGKITASVRQSKSQLRVSRAEYASVMVSLQAQTAMAYVNLRAYQAEMEVAKRHAESQLKVVHIAEARHKAGLASMLDVAQAKTVYYSTVASISQLEISIRSTINTIAVLLGEQPADLYAVLGRPGTMPDHVQLVTKNVPLDLINRRPDIVAARLNVASAADAFGIARKDYLPTLSLTGSIGTSAHAASDLFADNSFTYMIAPVLSWTLFDGFARRSATAEARQRLESEIDNYNQTVISAVGEADNAVYAYGKDLEYMEIIEEVVTQSNEALKLSLDLYKRGLSAFSNVVDAQLNLLEYQNSLIVAKGDALVSLINLYKAVGGGWINDIE